MFPVPFTDLARRKKIWEHRRWRSFYFVSGFRVDHGSCNELEPRNMGLGNVKDLDCKDCTHLSNISITYPTFSVYRVSSSSSSSSEIYSKWERVELGSVNKPDAVGGGACPQ